MVYKAGDLWRGPDGKIAVFDHDHLGNSGRFVKRLANTENVVGAGWTFEPAAGCQAEIAAVNESIGATSTDKPIPISDLVASGAIKSAPRPMPSTMSRTQPGTPHANDAFGREMARKGPAAGNTSRPAIDVGAIYESRRQQGEGTATAWDESIRRAKERNAPPSTTKPRTLIDVGAIYAARRAHVTGPSGVVDC